jgi:ESS family glutamate:Na+ symporter
METTIVNGILQLKINMYQALALGAIMYYFGVWLRIKIPALVKLSIPAPVMGGLPMAILAAILQANGIVQFAFDNTLQQVLMMCFFCTVGMNASYKLLIKGGLMVVAFWAVSSVVSVIQNLVGIPIVNAFGLNPLMSILAGSVPMIGGLGTAGAFGALFEDEYAVHGALSAAIACATFGMVAGSLIGGPLGEWIIKTNKIKTPNAIKKAGPSIRFGEVLEEVGEIAKTAAPADEEDAVDVVSGPHLMKNLAWVLISVGLGSTISYYLKRAGITVPPYLGAMIIAIIFRNIGDKSKKYVIDSKAVGMVGDITLALYITMAINSLQLVELVNLAMPLFIIMVLQMVVIMLIAYFLVFRLFGKNYDAVVMASGLCGFGLGATPNALVCMQALTNKHGYSERAFFVVPIVGSFLVDVSNATIIAIMTNWLR